MKPIAKVACAFALLVSIGLTPLAAQTTQPATKKIEPALSKLAADWAAGFNARDCVKVASLYTEDGALMPPNEPAARGRAAIQAWCQGALDGGFGAMTITPMESAISGSLAFEAGSYSVSIKGAGGPPMTDKGKYLTVFKQSGGQWRISHDIFNSDLPAAMPPKP